MESIGMEYGPATPRTAVKMKFECCHYFIEIMPAYLVSKGILTFS
jgi:hypothetical protein